MALKLIRKIDSGVLMVKDRRENDEGELEIITRMIKSTELPKWKPVQEPRKNADGSDMVDAEGKVVMRNDKSGKGEYDGEWDFSDEDFVLQNHSAIFVKA